MKKNQVEYIKQLKERRLKLRTKSYEVEDKLKETKVAKELKEVNDEIKRIDSEIEQVQPKRVSTRGDPIVQFKE